MATDNKVVFPLKTGLTICKHPNLYDFYSKKILQEPPALQKLRLEIEASKWAGLASSPDESQFLALLARLTKAKNCLEIGIFMGYTTLALALALPDDGKIVALDVNVDWTSVGQKYWKEAGVDHKIDLRIQKAIDSLDQLIESGKSGTFDLAFIDADKTNYDKYYESCLKLVRQGGVIAIDNVFWGGSILDESDQSDDTKAIRAINEKVFNDPRVSISVVPLADGVTLCFKN
eukprot:TRINITY_DN13043_c0_g1_i1.p1 TRINITY_DN13043_c0_g1~~TRINITY_DN13043_c0_g1_i1.p1  ORF type:complete len:232 (+),score=44.24 TRINITY_DN13043_c0_g1_i1:62-757(+)